jgi:hypothetical protein
METTRGRSVEDGSSPEELKVDRSVKCLKLVMKKRLSLSVFLPEYSIDFLFHTQFLRLLHPFVFALYCGDMECDNIIIAFASYGSELSVLCSDYFHSLGKSPHPARVKTSEQFHLHL